MPPNGAEANTPSRNGRLKSLVGREMRPPGAMMSNRTSSLSEGAGSVASEAIQTGCEPFR